MIAGMGLAITPRHRGGVRRLVGIAVEAGYDRIDVTAAPELVDEILPDDIPPAVKVSGPSRLAARIAEATGRPYLDIGIVEAASGHWPPHGFGSRALGLRLGLEVPAARLEPPPAVVQLPCDPTNVISAVTRARMFGAPLEALSPMGDWRTLLEHPAIVEAARLGGCTPAQAVIRWHLSAGRTVLTTPVHEERLRSNALLPAMLHPAARALIDSLARRNVRKPSP